MKTFDVYKHPVIGYEVVKQGFSWPAFFFTAIWAFVKKMWGHGIIIIGFNLGFSIIELALTGSTLGKFIIFVAQLGYFIFIGKHGNEWRRDSLRERGFEHLRTVYAESPDGAIAIIARLPEANEVV